MKLPKHSVNIGESPILKPRTIIYARVHIHTKPLHIEVHKYSSKINFRVNWEGRGGRERERERDTVVW